MAKQPIARCIGYIPVSGSTIFPAGKVIPSRPVFEAGVDYIVEVIAEDLDGIASVAVEIEDGANTVTKTATTETLSTYTPEKYQPNGAGSGKESVYQVTFTASELDAIDDGLVDVNFTVTDDNLGTTNTWTEAAINDAGGVATVHTVYCDPVNGDNANDASSMANARLTLDSTLEAVGGVANTATDIVICKVNPGTINFPSTVFPYLQGLSWVIIEPDDGVTQSEVIYNLGAGVKAPRLRFACFRGITFHTDASTTSSTSQLDGWSVYTDDEFWFDDCVWTHSLGIAGQTQSTSPSLLLRVNIGDRIWWTRCEIGDFIDDVKLPGAARDCKLFDAIGDGLRDPKYAVQITLQDFKLPPEVVRVNATTGATVGGIIYGTTSTTQATITQINTNYSVVIDTSGGVTARDFKSDEQVSGGIEYYAAGETPTVDTPAGTATHEPPHPDGIQNFNGVNSQVVSNIWFKNIDGQILFCDAVAVTQENCLRRNIFGNQTYNLTVLSQMGQTSGTTVLNHIIYHGVTIPNQKFYAQTGATNTYSNVLFKHCVFRDYSGDMPPADGTANGITIADCHATNPSATYTSSRGDAGFVDGVAHDDLDVQTSYDLRPAVGSTLYGMLASGERLSAYDAYGILIPNDGTGAIGALQGAPAAPNPPAAPAGSTGAYAYAGERFVYIVFDAGITYTEPGGFFVYPVTVSKPGGLTEAVNSLEVVSSNTLKIGFTGDTPAIGDSNWTVSISNGSGYITTTSNGTPVASFTNLAVGIAAASVDGASATHFVMSTMRRRRRR